MSKQRVYEIAKQLNMDQKALVSLFQSMGVGDVRNHMSAVESDVVERVKRHLERQKTPEVVEERIRPTVVKRQRRPTDQVPGARPSSPGEADIVTSAPTAETGRGAREVPSAPASTPVARGRVGREPPSRSSSIEAAPSAPATAAPRSRGATPSPEAPASRGRSHEERTEATATKSTARAEAPERARPPAMEMFEPATHEEVAHSKPSKSEPKAPPPVSATEAKEPATAQASERKAAHAEAPTATAASATSSEKAWAATAAASTSVSVASSASSAPSTHAAPVSPTSPSANAQTTPASNTSPANGEAQQAQPSHQAQPAHQAHQSASAKQAAAPATTSPATTSTPRTAVAPPPPAENAAAPVIPGPPAAPSPEASRALPDIGHTRVSPRPHADAPPPPAPAAPGNRLSQPPGTGVRKTGIDTWEGRPGVPMPQPRTTAAPRRTMFDPRANQSTAARPGGPTSYARPPGNRPPMMGGRGGPQNRFGPNRGPSGPRKPAMVSTQEMSSHKKVIKIEEQVTLQQLAAKMSVKATDVLMKLLSLGMSGVHINSTLDADTAKILAGEFGWAVEDVAVSEQAQLDDGTRPGDEVDVELGGRPPIVTVMGHVDHGKTSLLDRIRKASVADGEAGGITQHIGAYRVETAKGTIAFLDTPGHEAFTEMRARGAKVTDIVILVVAADDGVMPQTREAITHALAAKVPIVVAVNKIDKPGADPEKIRRDLAGFGLQAEEWGGQTMFREVSAKTGQGIDDLLDAVLLQAEVLELKANPKKRASGTVIEALLDRGRGPVARVMVQDGTLHTGDILLAGGAWGKVRAMTDELGRAVAEAGPATPVEVLGLNEVPSAGDPVHAVKDARTAEEIAETRRKKASKTLIPQDSRISLEGLADKLKEAEQLELKLIIKGDVQGSVEAVSHALAKLSAQRVRVTIVHAGVGGITEGDVNLAVASKAIIVGFNVRPAGKAAAHAESEDVEIRLYSIIYNAVDDIHAAMENLLPATKVEKVLGRAEVRQVFPIIKVGLVAGCMVQSGVIRRTAEGRLIRDGAVVWTGKLSGLRRFKDDAREVLEGFECGISLDGYKDIKANDIIECFEIEEIKTKLT